MAVSGGAGSVCVYNNVGTPFLEEISASKLSEALQRSMLKLKGKYVAEDGKGVDYKNIKNSEEFEEFKLQAARLQFVDLASLSEEERKAFFINIYNALTIHSLAELDQLPSSVLDLHQFWKTTAYKVGNYEFSLDDIEHGILRANKPHPASTQPQFKENDSRIDLVIKELDPRIHFALVCGAKSCPAINVYTSKNLDKALDNVTRSFCSQGVTISAEDNGIWLSKLFQWYLSDFGRTDVDAVRWILPYLPKHQQEKAQILLIRLEHIGNVDLNYDNYDWHLNLSAR